MTNTMESALTSAPKVVSQTTSTPVPQLAPPAPGDIVVERVESEDKVVSLMTTCCRTLTKLSVEDRRRFLGSINALFGEPNATEKTCKGCRS